MDIHRRTIKERKCVDCPAVIPASGNRKRCPECQDRAYRTRNSRKGRAASASVTS